MRYFVLGISFFILLARPLPVLHAQEIQPATVPFNEATEEDIDPQDVEKAPAIEKVYKPEDKAVKKARLRLIAERKKAELAKLKALQKARAELKRKEADRLKARARASAEDRKKIKELRKKREIKMRDLKRNQRMRRNRYKTSS